MRDRLDGQQRDLQSWLHGLRHIASGDDITSRSPTPTGHHYRHQGRSISPVMRHYGDHRQSPSVPLAMTTDEVLETSYHGMDGISEQLSTISKRLDSRRRKLDLAAKQEQAQAVAASGPASTASATADGNPTLNSISRREPLSDIRQHPSTSPTRKSHQSSGSGQALKTSPAGRRSRSPDRHSDAMRSSSPRRPIIQRDSEMALEPTMNARTTIAKQALPYNETVEVNTMQYESCTVHSTHSTCHAL